jgi:hypothetical protein
MPNSTCTVWRIVSTYEVGGTYLAFFDSEEAANEHADMVLFTDGNKLLNGERPTVESHSLELSAEGILNCLVGFGGNRIDA